MFSRRGKPMRALAVLERFSGLWGDYGPSRSDAGMSRRPCRTRQTSTVVRPSM